MAVKKTRVSAQSTSKTMGDNLEDLEKQFQKLDSMVDKARLKKLASLEKSVLSGSVQQKRLKAKLDKDKASLIKARASVQLKATVASTSRVEKYKLAVALTQTEIEQCKALCSTHKQAMKDLQAQEKYLKAKNKALKKFEEEWSKKVAKIEKLQLKALGAKKKPAPPLKEGQPKRRGRPPKAATVIAAQAAPKRRGRPPKNAAKTLQDVKKKAVGVANAQPKRRGRPPKNATKKTLQSVKKKAGRVADAQPKRRGRPPLNKAKVPSAPVSVNKSEVIEKPVVKSIFDEKEE